MISFTITDEMLEKLNQWIAEVKPKIVAQQLEAYKTSVNSSNAALMDLERGEPYEGCSGGGLAIFSHRPH